MLCKRTAEGHRLLPVGGLATTESNTSVILKPDMFILVTDSTFFYLKSEETLKSECCLVYSIVQILFFGAIVRVDDRCAPAVRSSSSSRPVPFARYNIASPPDGNDFESKNKSNAFTNCFIFAISTGA